MEGGRGAAPRERTLVLMSTDLPAPAMAVTAAVIWSRLFFLSASAEMMVTETTPASETRGVGMVGKLESCCPLIRA